MASNGGAESPDVRSCVSSPVHARGREPSFGNMDTAEASTSAVPVSPGGGAVPASPASAAAQSQPASKPAKRRDAWMEQPYPGSRGPGGYTVIPGAQALNRVEQRLFEAGIDVRGQYHRGAKAGRPGTAPS
eukprot:gnl/TRDRNA2_/TRDRNA2_128591_c0_seq1.p2 gnl/TRDRNA2_/TRDRNA2_128591_c0~~gnl/TRDRNA2_/TRDRNA2_128591_c0_seq1.p2  ORF type:complete len:142 (+),score=20.58 gnl/TRDRNA2_/TRDRNA2_128591_c0_seq1:34-426(+)